MSVHVPSAHENRDLPVGADLFQLLLPQQRIRAHPPLQEVPLSRPARRYQIETLRRLERLPPQTVRAGGASTLVRLLVQFEDVVLRGARVAVRKLAQNKRAAIVCARTNDKRH